MPAYNASSVIHDTIGSIVNQSYPAWELIVVDDCSTDNTFDILKTFAESDSRIKCFRNEKNLGSPLTRNEALRHISGRFVAFCDSDDMFLPNKLESQLKFMLENEVAFSYAWYRRVSSDLKRVGHLIKSPRFMTYKKLLYNTAICTSTVMIDKTAVNDLRMRNHHLHDFLLWLDVLSDKVDKAVCFEYDLVRYRVLENSFSSSKKRQVQEMYRCYSEILNLSFIKKMFCMAGYAYHALKKYIRF